MTKKMDLPTRNSYEKQALLEVEIFLRQKNLNKYWEKDKPFVGSQAFPSEELLRKQEKLAFEEGEFSSSLKALAVTTKKFESWFSRLQQSGSTLFDASFVEKEFMDIENMEKKEGERLKGLKALDNQCPFFEIAKVMMMTLMDWRTKGNPLDKTMDYKEEEEEEEEGEEEGEKNTHYKKNVNYYIVAHVWKMFLRAFVVTDFSEGSTSSDKPQS
ncbi:unnamed protein product, partial [marine sediment metagenome]